VHSLCLFIFATSVYALVAETRAASSGGFGHTMSVIPDVLVLALFTGLAGMPLTSLTCFHWGLVLRGVTTNEEVKGTYYVETESLGEVLRNCARTLWSSIPPSYVPLRWGWPLVAPSHRLSNTSV
jgi:hypothetical protein